jgi:Zn finger protein HypA/HybF involved in hydrogenase expression
MAIDLPKMKCKRCSHEWYPAKPLVPIVCPECKSPYWNIEKKSVVVTKERRK